MLTGRLMVGVAVGVLASIAPAGAGHALAQSIVTLPPPVASPPVAALPVPVGPLNPRGQKSLVVKFHITATALTVQGVSVQYGPAHTYIADPDLFRIAMLGASGQTLDGVGTYDPHGARIYAAAEPGRLREVYVVRPEADGIWILPFVPKVRALRFSDSAGRSYGTVPVADAIRAFCLGKPSDPECVSWMADFARSPAGPLRSP